MERSVRELEDILAGIGPQREISTRAGEYRLMNRDGSFNSQRQSQSRLESLNYLSFLTMRWSTFLVLLLGFYVGSNVMFALLYLLCGSDALAANGPGSSLPWFWRSFFFSVQTLSTIGYGALLPVGIPANLLVAVESVYGVLTYALITGLFFARFARIRAKIRFSKAAVIGSEKDRRFLRIRLTNVSSSEIVELHARLLFCHLAGPADAAVRKFAPLPIDPTSVAFLPLAWTMEHVIREDSPLYGLDRAAFEARRAEILVLVTGLDESSGQAIHARTSYTADELAFDATYHDMFRRGPEGRVLGIDLERFDKVDPESEPERVRPPGAPSSLGAEPK